MGHRVEAERADDVKMQVLVDPDEAASAGNGPDRAGSTGGDPRTVERTIHHHRNIHPNQEEEDVEQPQEQHHQRPLPRGTKRKVDDSFSRDQEEEEQEQRQQQRRQRARPLWTEGEGQEADSMDTSAENEKEETYVTHRQSLFNLSVHKLSRFRHSPDPSLRRSVLICNTLRCLEREMVGEGVELTPEVLLYFPALQPSDELTLDPPPPPPSPSPSPAPATATANGYERNLAELDCPSGRVTPHPAGGEGDSVRQQHQQQHHHPGRGEECCTSDVRCAAPSFSWSSVLNFSSLGTEGSSGHEEMWVRDCGGEEDNDSEAEGGGGRLSTDNDTGCHHGDGAGGAPNTSPSSSSDSGISTASDEIFGDIDLSLYDFDLLPLSLPADQLSRSIPQQQPSEAGEADGASLSLSRAGYEVRRAEEEEEEEEEREGAEENKLAE